MKSHCLAGWIYLVCNWANVVVQSHIIVKQNYIFAAIDHMKPLVDLERVVVSTARKYLSVQRQILNDIRPMMEEVQNAQHLIGNETTRDYLKNPVNNFMLAKRLTEDWKDLHSYMSEVDHAASKEQTIEAGHAQRWDDIDDTPIWLDNYDNNTPPKSSWLDLLEVHTTSQSTWRETYESHTPSSIDIEGATAAFIRLQDSYSITAQEFIEGKVSYLQAFKLQLTAEDCLAVAKWSLKETRYVRMKEWLLEAERLIKDPTIPHRHGNTTQQEVNEYLAYSFYLEDDLATALKYTELVLADDPTNSQFLRSWELYNYYHSHNIPMPFGESGFMNKAQEVLKELQSGKYLHACNNFNPQVVGYKDVTNLKCFLKQDHPLFVLKPIRVTQVHDNPEVFILHNIVSEKQIEQLKALATPRIKIAKVVDLESDTLVAANYRVSKSMFLLPDVVDEMEINDKLHPLFEAVTGLSMKHSETLQINNYGLGGQYEMHHDYGEVGTMLDKDPLGNRLATLLLYMSEIEFGGHTVFPDIGLTVDPSKGDAVFWYNLHRNGTGIFTTRHASCPVLSGSKWVANKWIRIAGNEFTRPCSLNRFE